MKRTEMGEKDANKSKQIKVAYASRMRKINGPIIDTRDAYLPKITMEGAWLEKIGFHVGDKLTVVYGEGAIHITRVDAGAGI